MTKKNIEKSISRAFETIVPDSLDKILNRCDEQKGEVVTMPTKKRKYSVVKWMAAAAALVVMLGGAVGYNVYNSNYAVASKVVVDVNPSIEILLNSKGKILKVVANNEDAKIIINDKEFSGQSLEEAVDKIVTSMVDNGYLNETANSILVSIEGKKAENLKLQETLTDGIEKVLQEQEFEASVIVQEVLENKELKKLADEHNVSVGKAELVKKLSEKVEKYNFEELVDLSINDLNILAETTENKIDISVKGEVSKKGYIEEGQASDITKAAILFSSQVGGNNDEIDAEDISNWECKMDFEDGKMVYDVQFTSKGKQHKFNIDAVLGDILEKDRFEKNEEAEDETSETTGEQPGETEGNEGDEEITKPNNNKPIKEKLEFNALTTEEIKAIILGKLGITEDAVTSFDVKMNFNFKGLCYEVKVVIGENEYEYRVNAVVGTVTEVEKEEKPDDGNEGKPEVDRPEGEVKPEDETKPETETKQETETKPETETKQETETKPGQDKPVQDRPNEGKPENGKHFGEFNSEKIKKLVLEKLGVTIQEIKDIDIDFEYMNGAFSVVVEVKMTDGTTVNYVIDAKTGEFIAETTETGEAEERFKDEIIDIFKDAFGGRHKEEPGNETGDDFEGQNKANQGR